MNPVSHSHGFCLPLLLSSQARNWTRLSDDFLWTHTLWWNWSCDAHIWEMPVKSHYSATESRTVARHVSCSCGCRVHKNQGL